MRVWEKCPPLMHSGSDIMDSTLVHAYCEEQPHGPRNAEKWGGWANTDTHWCHSLAMLHNVGYQLIPFMIA